MKKSRRSDILMSRREIAAEGIDLCVSILTRAAGERGPWHYHSEMADNIVRMEEITIVETWALRATYVLEPAQRCTIGPKIAHFAHGNDGGPWRYLIVQGVGIYDWMPVGG